MSCIVKRVRPRFWCTLCILHSQDFVNHSIKIIFEEHPTSDGPVARFVGPARPVIKRTDHSLRSPLSVQDHHHRRSILESSIPSLLPCSSIAVPGGARGGPDARASAPGKLCQVCSFHRKKLPMFCRIVHLPQARRPTSTGGQQSSRDTRTSPRSIKSFKPSHQTNRR